MSDTIRALTDEQIEEFVAILQEEADRRRQLAAIPATVAQQAGIYQALGGDPATLITALQPPTA